MGNSLTTLVRAKQSVRNTLSDISDLKFNSYPLKLIDLPANTYLFNQMTRNDYQAVFNEARFFNKEVSGLTLTQLENDEALFRIIKPIALFDTSDETNSELISIAEGTKVPFYAFTYGLELVQFYFEDSTQNLDENILDHSIIARKHAQYISSLIADEARLSRHDFSDTEMIFERLVRHEKLVSIRYVSSSSGMPPGMIDFEVYML